MLLYSIGNHQQKGLIIGIRYTFLDKAAGEETTRHHDTRVASWEPPAADI